MTMKSLIRGVLGLAAVAALTACGGAGDGAVAVTDLQKVAQGVARGEGRMSVQDLSRWIISGHQTFALLDLRSPEAYAAGHIEGAENHPLAELMNPEKLAALPEGRKLVVYSADSTEAAAASALLRLAGHDAQAVTGGYEAWDKEILHPDIPDVASVDEPAAIAEKRAIACYFVGGQNAAGEAPVYAPKSEPAFTPPVTSTPALRPHRSGEGC